MEIPDDMVQHIKEVAQGIDHGEILLKFNQTRNIIDVKAGNTVRFHIKEEKKPEVKAAGSREG